MNNFLYTIRSYRPADFNKFVRLVTEAEKLEPAGRSVSPKVIAERLNWPNYSPEQDLFLVETAKNIVGYMDVTPELAIGRVILDCWVHPEHRRRGLAAKLLGCAAHHARELGAGAAHVNVANDNIAARSVLSRSGFKCVRRFLELKLDMAKVSQQDAARAAQMCRHLRRGEEDKLTRIQNRSFAGSWGYNPNTVETITYRANLGTCSPEDVILASEGDRVTGYCWTETTAEWGAAGSERKGRIYMIGVDPDYRGRGVGKRVLLASLAYLKGKNLLVTELTVDSDNESALALYRSIGFELRTGSLWYEKLLD